MSRRLLILACAAAIFAAACGQLPQSSVGYGAGVEFVPYVADVLDDAGQGNAVAVDKDGVPYVSYLIFPAKPAAGAIPIPRPIGAPFIETTASTGSPSQAGTAVGVASVASDGVWTRGAAAQVQDSPTGVVVPYGPATVKGLIGATAQNTNGSDIAVDANGGKHVVWTEPDGIWYAGATATGAFTATQIYTQDPPLSLAGPIGRPSVAVDASGHPWVAFTVDTATGQSVEVASNDGSAWSTPTEVATIPLTSGGPQPGSTEIAMTADGPIVVYFDGVAGALMAARQTGKAWTTETIAGGIAPSGASLAVGSDGTVAVSYYTGKGEVDLARSSAPAVWDISKVATANPGAGTGNAAETTGVAIDGAGKVYVTWFDDATSAVDLGTVDQNGGVALVETRDTAGGVYPSVGVTADGSRVFLVWQDSASQDLLMGILGSADGLQVAAPSPTSTVTSAPASPAAACPKNGITLTAPSGAAAAGFSETDLKAPADAPFTICFDNQDSGIPHNVHVFVSQNGTSIVAGNIVTGPGQALIEVPAQKPGTYFFQCDIHPTTMTGTITVK